MVMLSLCSQFLNCNGRSAAPFCSSLPCRVSSGLRCRTDRRPSRRGNRTYASPLHPTQQKAQSRRAQTPATALAAAPHPHHGQHGPYIELGAGHVEVDLSVRRVTAPKGGCSTYLCYAVWHLRELSWMGSLLQVVLPCAPSRQARSQQPLSLPLPCRPAE